MRLGCSIYLERKCVYSSPPLTQNISANALQSNHPRSQLPKPGAVGDVSRITVTNRYVLFKYQTTYITNMSFSIATKPNVAHQAIVIAITKVPVTSRETTISGSQWAKKSNKPLEIRSAGLCRSGPPCLIARLQIRCHYP